MTRRALLASLILTALSPLAAEPQIPRPATPHVAQATSESDTSFALALYREVSNRPGNLVISPFSLSTCLTMLYAGSAGDTATQMAQVLHLSPNPHAPLGALLKDLTNPNAHKIRVANRIWPALNLKLHQEFIQLLNQHYEAGLESVDYVPIEKARQHINHWVSEQTQGKIPELLSKGALDSKTALILTNAIFFQGKWLQPFPASATTEGSFRLRDGKSLTCPMMRLSGTFNYACFDSVQPLELPYRGDRLSMILVLPPPNHNLENLEQRLNETLWQQWMLALNPEPASVTLPRFKISTDLSLAGALRAVGLSCLFENCDLSRALSQASGVTVSDCIHQAVIEVNEEGTVAAAATAVVISRSVPRQFDVNRPCLFAVRDRISGSLLFLGRLENPASDDSP